MKKHLTPVARKFGPMGFDIRSKEQKVEDEGRADEGGRGTRWDLESRTGHRKAVLLSRSMSGVSESICESSWELESRKRC